MAKKEEIKENPLNLEEEKKKTEEGYSKQLRLVVLGIVFLFIVVGIFYLVYNTTMQFEYKGTSFKKVKFGDLLFYQVSFPLYSQVTGEYINDFNFFLRKDPRTLESIPINGDIKMNPIMILNADENLICKDNGIAMYHGALGK